MSPIPAPAPAPAPDPDPAAAASPGGCQSRWWKKAPSCVVTRGSGTPGYCVDPPLPAPAPAPAPVPSPTPSLVLMPGRSQRARDDIVSLDPKRSSRRMTAPKSWRWRMARPTAWFSARKACCLYHAPASTIAAAAAADDDDDDDECEDEVERAMRARSSWNCRLRTICGSVSDGYGMPTTTTALQSASAKSSPSLALPRHTARSTAPVRPLPAEEELAGADDGAAMWGAAVPPRVERPRDWGRPAPALL
jgi:hypothetical protein